MPVLHAIMLKPPPIVAGCACRLVAQYEKQGADRYDGTGFPTHHVL